MFKARFMTGAELDEAYRDALARYERILLHQHLLKIAAAIPAEWPDDVRAKAIIAAIEVDQHEP